MKLLDDDHQWLASALISWGGLLVSLLLSGCKSPPVKIHPEVCTLWKSYSVGTEIFTPTGSPMLATREGYTRERYRIVGTIPSPISRPVPNDGEWVVTHLYYGDCGDGRFVVTNPVWYAGAIGFIVNPQGVLPCEFAVLDLRKARTWSVGDLARRQAFEPLETRPTPDKTEFSMELIYGGQSSSATFVTYREFAAGRPSSPRILPGPAL